MSFTPANPGCWSCRHWLPPYIGRRGWCQCEQAIDSIVGKYAEGVGGLETRPETVCDKYLPIAYVGAGPEDNNE